MYIFLLFALIVASPARALEWCGQEIEEGATYVKCDDPKTSDLSPIADLKSVKTLSLIGTGVSDLSPIANWVQLKRLVINNTPVSNLSPVVGMKSLKALSAKESLVRDLSSLAALESLEDLNIADCPKVDPKLEKMPILDLSPLSRLPKLKKLNVAGVKIEGFEALKGLPLKRLTTESHVDWNAIHPARVRYEASLCELLKAQPKIRGTHCEEPVEGE